ncbi:hypothetical protein V1511DRAFT_501508 [Dipodascopsis uninucleata]
MSPRLSRQSTAIRSCRVLRSEIPIGPPLCVREISSSGRLSNKLDDENDIIDHKASEQRGDGARQATDVNSTERLKIEEFINRMPKPLSVLPGLTPWAKPSDRTPHLIVANPKGLGIAKYEILEASKGFSFWSFLSDFLQNRRYNYLRSRALMAMSTKFIPVEYANKLSRGKNEIIFSVITGKDIAHADPNGSEKVLPPAVNRLEIFSEQLNFDRNRESKSPEVEKLMNAIRDAMEKAKEVTEQAERVREYFGYEFLRGAALSAREFMHKVIEAHNNRASNESGDWRDLCHPGLVNAMDKAESQLLAESESVGSAASNHGNIYLDWALEDPRTTVRIIDVHTRIGYSSRSLDQIRHGRKQLQFAPDLPFSYSLGFCSNITMLPLLTIEDPFGEDPPLGIEYTIDVEIIAPVTVGFVIGSKRYILESSPMQSSGSENTMVRTVVSYDSSFISIDIRKFTELRKMFKSTKNARYPENWVEKSWLSPSLVGHPVSVFDWTIYDINYSNFFNYARDIVQE